MSFRRKVARAARLALPPGRRPGQPRAADDPPTVMQVHRKDLWDNYVDSEGRAAPPRAPLFESMGDLLWAS